MESLARMVALILFFPLIVSPVVFLLVRQLNNRAIMIISLPLSIISAALGLFLLLSQIGIVARGFGLWGLLFAVATWKIIVKRVQKFRNTEGGEGFDEK